MRVERFAEVGGPVYPDEKDVGGGARDAQWTTAIAARTEPGERLILTGTVLGRNGKPRVCVTVYTYPMNRNGPYRKKPWRRPRLRGWARTNADGKYEFRTIKSQPYPVRRNPTQIHMTIAIPARSNGGIRSCASLPTHFSMPGIWNARQ